MGHSKDFVVLHTPSYLAWCVSSSVVNNAGIDVLKALRMRYLGSLHAVPIKVGTYDTKKKLTKSE